MQPILYWRYVARQSNRSLANHQAGHLGLYSNGAYSHFARWAHATGNLSQRSPCTWQSGNEKINRICIYVLHMQHHHKACALDVGDDQSGYLWSLSIMFVKLRCKMHLFSCVIHTLFVCVSLYMYICLCHVLMCFEGIFAPLSKISKFASLSSATSRGSLHKLNYGRVQVSHITAKVDTGDDVKSPIHLVLVLFVLQTLQTWLVTGLH